MIGYQTAGAAVVGVALIAGAYGTGFTIGKSKQAEINAIIAAEVAVETADKLRKAQKARDNIVNAFYKSTLSESDKINELQQQLVMLQKKSTTTVCNNPDNFSERLLLISKAADCESLREATDKPFVVSDTDGLYSYTIGLAASRCKIAEQLNSLILTVRDNDEN